MKFHPGKWSERLFEGSNTGAGGRALSLGDHGAETTAAVMAMAQEHVSWFTVVIGTAGVVKDSKNVWDIAPGSGVTVRLNGGTYGVLTAGHVLRRDDNTRDSAAVTVLVPPRGREQGGDVMALNLLSRPCTVDGFDNEGEEGPDIAIIPLTNPEWRILEGWGMIGYNLDKERWSEEDRAELDTMDPWLVSVINGVRCKASHIVHEHRDGETGSLAIMASNTRVEVVRETSDYDFLELPSQTTEFSYPTRWKNGLPEKAAEEIDQLHDEGVTRRVWGGTSGAGVWNLAIGTNPDGFPNGKVLAELAGICFYANPDKGCIVAHGTKSIARIAADHVEKEALRYHNKA